MSNLRKAQAHMAQAAYYAYRFGTDDCAICGDSLSGKKKTVTCLNGHKFHKECMVDFIKEGLKNICPTCRDPFFTNTEIEDLPSNVKALISDDDTMVVLNKTSSEELNQMLNDNSTIQNTDFQNCMWSNATIGLQDITYSFVRCVFRSIANKANFWNVEFYNCKMIGSAPGGETMGVGMFYNTQFNSVKFRNIIFQALNLRRSVFNACNFQGEAIDTTFERSKFNECVMHEFHFSYSLVLPLDSLHQCKFNKVTLESCEWSQLSCESSVFIDCTMIQCTFSDVNMSSIMFSNCTLKDCTFKDCTLDKADLHDSIFKDCNFRKCTFTETVLNRCQFSSTTENPSSCYISKCEFTDVITQGVSFRQCMLLSNTFNNGSFPMCNITKCTLKHCKFTDVTLEKADFTESRITNCSFESDHRGIMSGSTFSRTKITQCKFHCHLRDVEFAGSEIATTEINDPFHDENLEGAIRDGVRVFRKSKRIRREVDRYEP